MTPTAVHDAFFYGFALRERDMSPENADEFAFGLDLILDGLERLRNPA